MTPTVGNDLPARAALGLQLAHPDLLTVVTDPLLVLRADAPVRGKVAVLSGGGSGHEPMHSGFVGPGMLDAAVPGPLFTAPPPHAILAASRAVDGGRGVLHLVSNHSGDVLNFDLAAESAAAEGIDLRTVLIAEEATGSPGDLGRRGLAGTVLVEKIAGAAATRGDDLDAVAAAATRATHRMRTMGLARGGCTMPTTGEPSFPVPPGHVELGVGLHGERGRRLQPADQRRELVELLLVPILSELACEPGEPLLLLVNGLGATTLAELQATHAEAVSQLRGRGLRPVRSLVGNYATALDMVGMSLTVLKLDDELIRLWDAPVRTAALRRGE